jgi:hypothetical protein
MAQVDVTLSRRQAQEVALAQDRGQQGGDTALAELAAFQHQMRQPWMLAQTRHRAAVRRDCARFVQRAEIDEQGACRSERRGRRWRQPGQGGVIGAP